MTKVSNEETLSFPESSLHPLKQKKPNQRKIVKVHFLALEAKAFLIFPRNSYFVMKLVFDRLSKDLAPLRSGSQAFQDNSRYVPGFSKESLRIKE